MTDLVARLARARAETLALISLVEDADLNRSLNPEFSPLRWHLGHVAAFEAHWVLVRAGGESSLSDEYDYLFDPTRNPKAARIDLPPRSELLAYGERVRGRVVEVLARSTPDHPDPLLRDEYVGEMVYEHECQHQEILTFLLQMIPPGRKRRPDGWSPAVGGVEPSGEMVDLGRGKFLLGAHGHAFAYDNERPEFISRVDDFRLSRSPATELQLAGFIEAGGYVDESLWSAEGRRWARESGVVAPRDWSRVDGGWQVRTMFEDRAPLPGMPVVGLAQHEAAAFARWSGGRLPTEVEWERAAAWDDAVGPRRYPWGDAPPDPAPANVDGLAWGVRQISARGRSATGLDDLAGQVWEWTSSSFDAYRGFEAFPYEGCSKDWFDGQHRVLKGGSWATRGRLCRASFRNWYHPHVREMFAGCRVAR